MPVTLRRMGRKKRDDATPVADAGTVEKHKADPIRVDADIARMLSIIATASGKTIAEIVSPLLRSPITEMYAETVARLNQEVEQRKES